MPRRRRPQRLDSVRLEASRRKSDTSLVVMGRDSTEAVATAIKAVETSAQKLGLNLKVMRDSGGSRSMVSFSGISQEAWNKIFGKKRRKRKGK